MKYGRLTLIGDRHPVERRKRLYKCECGKEKYINFTSVNMGKSQSCGCLAIEILKQRTGKKNSNFKHGFNRGNEPLYKIWQGMKQRCTDKNVKSFHNYGGRGISVCKEWINSFPTFRKWARTHGYKEGLELDRRNNDGDYKPSNCRWVTTSVNARNRRTNRKINGVCITDLSIRLNGSNNLINERLKAGWDINKSISLPKRKYTYRTRTKRM